MNIGTIGHVDNGKTTLTAAISRVLAENKDHIVIPFDSVDIETKEMGVSKQRGITPDMIMLDEFKRNKRPRPEDHPNFVNKGLKGKRCNRTACETEDAYYYNRVTMAYYCEPCADGINGSYLATRHPHHNFAERDQLCSLSDEDSLEWNNKYNEAYDAEKEDRMGLKNGAGIALATIDSVTGGIFSKMFKPSTPKKPSYPFTRAEKKYLETLHGKNKKKAIKLLKAKYDAV